MKERINVLDKGFVKLIDHMGNDASIVQAAKISYGDEANVPEANEKLIRHLLKNGHTSPFEQVIFKFYLKLPLFVARQLVRHRTASINEVSGRYSVLKSEAYLPETSRIKIQGLKDKKELNYLTTQENVYELFKKEQLKELENYNIYLKLGVTKELGRINLPLSVYTKMYWTMDLHNLLHFLELRLNIHAQYEIRVYAEAIKEIINEIVPLTIRAFDDYTLGAKKFSKQEIKTLKNILNIYEQSEKTIVGDKEKELLKKIKNF